MQELYEYILWIYKGTELEKPLKKLAKKYKNYGLIIACNKLIKNN